MIDAGSDAGEDAGADGGADAGIDAGSTCPPFLPDLPDPDQCDVATRDCLADAEGDVAMQNACVRADSTPTACLACLNAEILATCAADAGCDDEIGLVECCVDLACPTGDMTCTDAATDPGGACIEERDAVFACAGAGSAAGTCGISATLCFRDE